MNINLNDVKSIAICEKKARENPLSAQAHFDLGKAYEKEKDHERAITAYQKATKLDPSIFEIWHFLGNLLVANDQKAEGVECYKKFFYFDPFQSEVRNMKALYKTGDINTAKQIGQLILRQFKYHPQAIEIMADISNQFGTYEEAEEILNRGLTYSPYNIVLWFKLLGTLAELGKHAERINVAKKLYELEPDIIQTSFQLGMAYAEAGQYKNAIKAFQQGLRIDPNCPYMLYQYGLMLNTIGEKDKSQNVYRECLKFKQYKGGAYCALANLKFIEFKEEEIKDMKQFINDEDCSVYQASLANFALGKAYENKKEFGEAFKYYDRGNKLKEKPHFHFEEYINNINNLPNVYTKEILEKRCNFQTSSIPIFIVSLPRSGSTLMEQILASHSQVDGTRELNNFPKISRDIEINALFEEKTLFQALKALDKTKLEQYGRNYLDQTAIYHTGKKYYTDKLPMNFCNVGLIHKILPSAIIIDIRRHPLDNGLSNYKQTYASGNFFSYDLDHIGQFYNSYLKIMDYWDEVLPGKIHHISYEKLVYNTEVEVRKLLNHCNLTFEKNCLEFHKNKRAVITASSDQVRRPINDKSIGYWKNFEENLTPLINALGKNTLKRFN